MTHTRTAAAAVAMCAMLAAGCTDSSADPTLPAGTETPSTTPTPTETATPTPTMSPTPTPTPTQADPTAADIEQAVTDYRNIFLDLPPTTPDEIVDVVTTATDTTTTPGGSARQEALAYADQFESGEATAVVRGNPYAEVLEPPTYDGLSIWSAQVCVASDGYVTQLDDPTPAEGDDPFIDPYGITTITVVSSDDHGWVLQNYDRPEAKDIQPCAPAAIREAITTAWDEMLELDEAWGAAGTSVEALKPLEDYWTGELLAAARDNAGTNTILISRDVYYDLELTTVSLQEATTEWCRDPVRDPDGKVIVNDTGDELAMGENPPAVERGFWIRDGKFWKLDRWESTFQGTAGSPEEHRCF